MCKITTTIKFCTCDVITDVNAVSWKLNRCIGTKGNHIMGTVMRTKSDFGDGITVDSVLNTLNSKKNTFDFEYSPSEKDCLTIVIDKDDYASGYFKLKFKNGNWVEGCGHSFNSMLELVGKGKIQMEKHTIEDDKINLPKNSPGFFNWLWRKNPHN